MIHLSGAGGGPDRSRKPGFARRPPAGILWLALLVAAALIVGDAVRMRSSGKPEPAQPPSNATPTAAASPSRDAKPVRLDRPKTEPTPSPMHSGLAYTLTPRPVRVPATGFLSWALLGLDSGQLTGSANLAVPSDTMSMIKAWLAADYLRTAQVQHRTPTTAEFRQLRIMIRDSDNAAASAVYDQLGRSASIMRLVTMCGLTDSGPRQDNWSNTAISARDTVRMGACLATGRAAGSRWTPWLLNEMRQVRGAGDFGVRSALPSGVAARVAIKNGWLLRDEDGMWHISCLAIGEGWALGVLARYPARLGFGYGTQLCRAVGEQLIVR